MVCNFIKKRLQHRCFPWAIVKFLRAAFLQNTSSGCFWQWLSDAYPVRTWWGYCCLNLIKSSRFTITTTVITEVWYIKAVFVTFSAVGAMIFSPFVISMSQLLQINCSTLSIIFSEWRLLTWKNMQKESRKIMSTTLYVRALQLGQGEKER